MEIYDTGDQTKGLGARSTKSLLPGDTVVKESPLVYSPRSGCCNHCLKPLRSPKVCSKCKFSVYCSRKCQVNDFKLYHREECVHFCRFRGEGHKKLEEYLTPTVRTSVKLLILKKKNPKIYEKFTNLCIGIKSVDELHEKTREMYLQIAMSIILFTSDEKTKINVSENHEQRLLLKEILDNLCRLKNNTFQISHELIHNVGIGVYENGARFNHSCKANCVQTFGENGTLEIKSLIEIPKIGTELTVKYCDIIQTRAERQKELLENYHFVCKCQRCFYNDSLDDHATKINEKDPETPAAIEKSTILCEKVLTMFKSLNQDPDILEKKRKCQEDALSILKEIYDLQKKHLGLYNTKRYRPIASLFRLCLDLKLFDDTMTVCEDLIQIMGKYLYPTEPLVLHQRVMYLKLAWYNGMEKYSMVEVKKLQRLVYAFFDKKSDLVMEFNCIVQQIFSVQSNRAQGTM